MLDFLQARFNELAAWCVGTACWNNFFCRPWEALVKSWSRLSGRQWAQCGQEGAVGSSMKTVSLLFWSKNSFSLCALRSVERSDFARATRQLHEGRKATIGWPLHTCLLLCASQSHMLLLRCSRLNRMDLIRIRGK